MKVTFYDRQSISQLSKPAWLTLAENSTHANPFYTYWCLVPAMEHLSSGEEVEVAALWDGDLLRALVPLSYKQCFIPLRWAEIWNHKECFLNTPLFLERKDWLFLQQTILIERGLVGLYINSHSGAALVGAESIHTTVYSYHRACVGSASDQIFINNLKGKRIRENQRIIRRLMSLEGFQYTNTGDKRACIDLLATYAVLEAQGWKGGVKTAIACSEASHDFYRDVFELGGDYGAIQAQELRSKHGALAYSFRYISQNSFFEIKTTYNEEFRSLSPGVGLELLNLQELQSSAVPFIDSCSKPGNKVLNRTWPAFMNVYNTIIYRKGLLGLTFWMGISFYKKIKYRDADCSQYRQQFLNLLKLGGDELK